jgi:hypothetical protein
MALTGPGMRAQLGAHRREYHFRQGVLPNMQLQAVPAIRPIPEHQIKHHSGV